MKYKTDKGVAGLTILLSLVVMLFVIGLLVMIFSLMGSELSIATYETTTVAFENATTSKIMNNTVTLALASTLTGVTSTLRDCSLTISEVTNQSTPNTVPANNYTTTGCKIYVVGEPTVLAVNTTWNVSGTYTYSADTTATDTMNETTQAISGVSDWFGIFIVIGAMVVLILLTVIIITAIRGSGMVSGGESSGKPKSIGTA